MSKKVLVVDDEKLIVKGIRFSLEQDGMEVDCAYDGEEAVEKAKEKKYDIILLDLMLPKMDGLEVCQQIREFSNVPIVMLTAKGDDMDKILGLEYGADDYITKPFGTSEMLARIRAAIRHSRAGYQGPAGGMAGVFEAKDLLIDYDKHRAYKGGLDLNLTQNEFRLVSLLSRYAGKVLTYDFMIREIWGPNMENNNRILRVNMANIRRKLEKNPAQPEYIFTEIGVGYRMIEPEG